MWRKAKTLSFLSHRPFSSSTPETPNPTLYSFLQPSIFSLNKTTTPLPKTPSQDTKPQPLTQNHIATLETNLHQALITSNTDEAWKSFKTLTANSVFPSKSLTNSLITHLSSLSDIHSLKRAFASVIYIIEKNPDELKFETLVKVLDSMKTANTAAPAFALIRCMFKNRYFVPFGLWGNVVVEITRKNKNVAAFLRVFDECCRIAKDEKLDFMKPDLPACNAALEGCCCELESVSDAENVVETMSVLGIRPDESSFGFLAYLYALKGLEEKIIELENLMGGFGFSNKRVFFSNLISGYVKLGNLEFVSKTILRSLKVEGEGTIFGEETYCEVVKGFLNNGGIKGLATLIIKAQKLEASDVVVDSSVGYGIVNACVKLGLSDKAHSILEEMDVQGGSVGLGVYVPILKAYCKEHRTAEATQLVMEISNLGLQLDVEIYDALIEASMSSQDFPSAFSLFRDMREARIPELKGSYLTIMTGLMENHRPELMAAFLDEVVEDPRIEVGTHDWNSIIHAFCKSGRLEDARRTLRRMIFLQFEPNDQTYLSLINGYVTVEKYFSVLMLWNEVKRKVSSDGQKGVKFDHTLVDAFLYALVKGGFFDAVMQVVEKTQEMKIFVDKWSTPINGTCDDTCGTIPIKYPFGTGFGCGHPVFARYIKCSSGTLQFSTGTGIYTISSIDYPSNTIVLTDPLMSTCSSMQNSGSFILDRTSPFTITSDVIFVLLGCSTTSPVFDADEELCDTGSGSRICRGLYSCKGVTGIGLPQNAPVSTCCVYDSPLGLGSGYALDLPKLQCSSYTSIYGFGDDEGDPMKWKFGISLQYNDSYDTETCKDCEASGGLCGFAGLDQSFACVCKNGANSSNNCLGRGYAWSGTWGLKIQLKMILGGIWLSWMLLFL
ncbi:hypothetical protein RGQ29_016024 [Quercus rubra]|uniref:non-specific serine/threonine protein kinase n=1 Tax=Quercus rubra TaxID=3512 RepID=A0AAN7FRI3_QUERU|nr:hypothetical protein RGQ29_016024 [Quercus rubra]